MTDYPGHTHGIDPSVGRRAQSAIGSLTFTTVYDIEPPPEPDPPDVAPPQISDVDPPAGPGMGIRRFQPVRFTVTDDRGIVAAFINDGDGYAVYNSSSFMPRYGQSSLRVTLTEERVTSMSFEIRRRVGWGSRPKLTISILDGAGNRAVLSV